VPHFGLRRRSAATYSPWRTPAEALLITGFATPRGLETTSQTGPSSNQTNRQHCLAPKSTKTTPTCRPCSRITISRSWTECPSRIRSGVDERPVRHCDCVEEWATDVLAGDPPHDDQASGPTRRLSSIATTRPRSAGPTRGPR
jgi:hypothetical protein